VLLYDEEALESTEKITLLARKLISWVTIKTSDGDLYEIDNALRPNGSSGLLVSSFAAYEKYQKQLDLNSAWTWEHQALTRARFCFGSEALRKRFEQVRKDVLSVKREEEELKEDVFEMRSKLWASQKSKMGLLNGKFSPGGMVDVEFVVQYLILSKSNMYLELTENIGNIALLKLAEDRGLIPSGLGDESANAYRHLRKKQHLASLEETNLILQDGDLVHTEVVKKLWLQFFKPYW
jgi:glutamate-ammonia-ligase adenylyltransferase